MINNEPNLPQISFDRYATLKLEVSKLEAELEALKPTVIAFMQEQHADQVEHSAGLFVLQARRTWTYPEEIALLDKKLKEKKEIAEQTGEATYKEKPVLIFRTNAD